jgi:hypothetical protein
MAIAIDSKPTIDLGIQVRTSAQLAPNTLLS